MLLLPVGRASTPQTAVAQTYSSCPPSADPLDILATHRSGALFHLSSADASCSRGFATTYTLARLREKSIHDEELGSAHTTINY